MESADSLVTSTKLLVFKIKFDSSDPDYTKVDNAFFTLFLTFFMTLFKTLPILFTEISAPFYSFFVCLICSCISNVASLVVNYGSIWLPSQMFLALLVLIDPSLESLSVDKWSIEDKIDASSSALHSFSAKPPYSKCAKVITFPFCSWYYVVYGMYQTYGCIVSASEWIYDVYTNALENVFSNKKSHEKYFFVY